MKNRSTVRSLLCLVTTTVMLICAWRSAEGAVIYSGIQNIPIATDFDGVFLNVQTAEHSTSTITGWNVNFFFGGIGEYNDESFQPVRVSNHPFAAILNIPNGTIIDGTSMFAAGIGGSGDVGSEHVGSELGQFAPGETGIIAFKLTGTTPKYGWMRVIFTLDEAGGTIQDWGYDDTGHGIAAGATSILAVPEPARAGLMITGFLGLLLRRRRVVGEFDPRNPDSEGTTSADQLGSVRCSSLVPKIVLVAFTMISPVFALDLDSDGLSDVFQHRYSLPTGPDALTRDTDGDGQSDLREFLFGTDPTDATSVPQAKPMFRPDGVFTLNSAMSGALYGLEVSTNLRTWTQAVAPAVAPSSAMTITVTPKPGIGVRKYYRFTAPTSQPDADGDGLNVIEEALLGTSDNAADSDHDGLPDAWEARYQLDPAVANADGDPDNDGLTNLEEFLANTDPNVANNAPPMVAFVGPISGSEASATSPLALEVVANDPDFGDSVTVTFFERGNNLGAGIANAGHYSLSWNSPVAGERVILARARDNHANDAWAALAVSIKPTPSETTAFGPVEGGLALTIAANADDLRSTPFVSKPVFAAAIGSVSGGTLTFDEQPNWTPGAYQGGYFIYVRSGSQRGAVLPVSGNSDSALTVSVSNSLIAGDLIALIAKTSLDSLLPSESVHSTSKVFTSLATTGPWYQRDVETGWHSNAGVAVNVAFDPWSTFRVIHSAGAASTSFQPYGDVASGPVRTITAPNVAVQDIAFGVASVEALSLIQTGLADASMVRDANDSIEVRKPDSSQQTWTYARSKWKPNSGTDDGSTAVVLPGGAIIIHRAPAAESTTWIQPVGK